MGQKFYVRKGILSIKEVLKNVPSTIKHDFVGEGGIVYPLRMNGQRLELFKREYCRNNLKCKFCGAEAKYFAIEAESIHAERNVFHANLYAEKNGKDIILTRDHILPVGRSKNNSLWNMQILCYDCNQGKDNDASIKDYETMIIKSTLRKEYHAAYQLRKKQERFLKFYKYNFIVNFIIKYPIIGKYYQFIYYHLFIKTYWRRKKYMYRRPYIKGDYQKKQTAKYLDHFGQKAKPKVEDVKPEPKESADEKK